MRQQQLAKKLALSLHDFEEPGLKTKVDWSSLERLCVCVFAELWH